MFMNVGNILLSSNIPFYWKQNTEQNTMIFKTNIMFHGTKWKNDDFYLLSLGQDSW